METAEGAWGEATRWITSSIGLKLGTKSDVGETRGAMTGLGTLGGALNMEGRRGVPPRMVAAASVAPTEDESRVPQWNKMNWNQRPNTQIQRYRSQTLKTRR